MELTDICCNLTHESFDRDRDQVLSRARKANVTRFLLAGCDLAESRACIALAEQHEDCWAAIGVHPHYALSWPEDGAEQLRELSRHPKVIALGECGLDYFRDLSPRPLQREVFAKQLVLARQLRRPLLLHCRDAKDDFLSILDAHRPLPNTVLHCFTEDEEMLHACLERDLYIGFTGWFCDERRGTHLQRLAQLVPADRLMLETDAPYLLPRTLKPKPGTRRNEPMWLRHIAEQIAEVRGESLEELARLTSECAQKCFGFPDPEFPS